MALAGIAALAAIASPVTGRTSEARDAADLLAAEDVRVAAQVAGDADAMARYLGDELVYSHADGRIQTKAELLTAMRGGMRPASIVLRDRIVRIFGDTGMVRGARDQRSGERIMTDTYLGVYVKRAGRWQLVAWQTTPLPPTR